MRTETINLLEKIIFEVKNNLKDKEILEDIYQKALSLKVALDFTDGGNKPFLMYRHYLNK